MNLLRTRSLTRSFTIGFTVATTVAAPILAQDQLRVASPNGRTVVTIGISEGRLYYAVNRDNRPLMLPSRLGMEFQGARPLAEGLRITGSTTSSADTTWTQPWGEVARVRDRHNERRVSVTETGAGARNFVVVFRVFDDGLGFRYEFPTQPTLGHFTVMGERTEFNLTGDHKSFWITGDYDTNEYA